MRNYFKTFVFLPVVILVCSGLLSACAGVDPNAVQEAHLAYAQQNYGLAYRKLLKAANHGDPKAEYALGFLYYHGLGAPYDVIQARIWMLKAADQNYLPAKKALAIISSSSASLFTDGGSHSSKPSIVAEHHKKPASVQKRKAISRRHGVVVSSEKYSMPRNFKAQLPLPQVITSR